jgi:hypothetical protein
MRAKAIAPGICLARNGLDAPLNRGSARRLEPMAAHDLDRHRPGRADRETRWFRVASTGQG